MMPRTSSTAESFTQIFHAASVSTNRGAMLPLRSICRIPKEKES